MADKRLWELLAKQFDGPLTEGELRELQALLNLQQDTVSYGDLLPELKQLLLRPAAEDKTARNNSLSDLIQVIQERQRMEEEARLTEKATRRSRIRYTCTVTLLVLLVAYFIQRETRSYAGKAESYDRVVTKAGSRTLINLPDNSTVTLNSSCQFSYNKDFGVRRREMHLTGEAFFDIHTNPDMPLVVHAGNVIIRVLGTAFNVKANAGDSFVEATLIRGVIEVSLTSDPERKILLRPNEKIVIRNDPEKGVLPPDSSRNVRREEVIRVTQIHVDPKDSTATETAWMNDRLVFKKESFVSLARRLEHFYQVKIILTDSSLESILFTGSFEKETLEEAFQALQHSASFDYTIDGKTITVTRRK